MKKILNTALIALILSMVTLDTINARIADTDYIANQPTRSAAIKTKFAQGRGRRPRVRGGRRTTIRGVRNKAKDLQVIVKTATENSDPIIRQEAKRTANQIAQELLQDLEERTWTGDILGKYTPEQVSNAANKYTKLAIQKDQLERDIEAKQAELDGMSTRSMLFWSKAEGGKEEAHKIASQELAQLKATLKDVNKAMRNQAVIAGKEAASTIRMAVSALTAAGIAGIAYGIDKYRYEGAGVRAMKEFASEQYGEYQEKGLRGYASKKISGMKTYATDRIQAIKDLINYYWPTGNKPKEITEKEKAAIKAQQEADAAHKKSAQNPNNENLEIDAENKQENADDQQKILEDSIEKFTGAGEGVEVY